MEALPLPTPLHVLIVEDDPAMQARLGQVLLRALPQSHHELAASLGEAREALARRPHLLLLDVNLPDGSGLDLLPWLHAQAPGTQTVIVSSLGDDATILQALRGGAIGYLLKNGSDAELELSLASIQRGGAPLDPVIARRILSLMAVPAPSSAPIATIRPDPAKPPSSALSSRETQVLQLVAQGHSNGEIAQSLNLSLNTIECHAKSIYRKLAVHSRAAAVHQARSVGWLD